MMLRTNVRPRLREVGFRAAGSVFSWPTEDSIAQVGLQKHRTSNRHEVWFTANVTVVGLNEWEAVRAKRPDFPERPSANVYYFGLIWQRRVGHLMPDGLDKWWILQADDGWQEIADDFVAAVEKFVLPELRQRA